MELDLRKSLNRPIDRLGNPKLPRAMLAHAHAPSHLTTQQARPPTAAMPSARNRAASSSCTSFCFLWFGTFGRPSTWPAPFRRRRSPRVLLLRRGGGSFFPSIPRPPSGSCCCCCCASARWRLRTGLPPVMVVGGRSAAVCVCGWVGWLVLIGGACVV